MSAGNVFELSVNFLQQFFALIADRPDFSVPPSWESANQYFRSINFGMDFIRNYIPDLSDFRIYFLTVSVLVPLFFTYLGLIFVNPLRVILWYFILMVGILMVIVGAAARIVNQIASSSSLEIQVPENAANIVAGIGAGVIFVCIMFYGCRERLLVCCNELEAKRNQNKHMSLEDKIKDETEDISWNTTISRFVTAGVLFTLGASFVGVIDLQGPQIPIQSLARGLGWFMIAVAIPIFFYMIIGLFQAGREWQWKVANWMEHNFLRLYLLSLSLIYIPVGSGLFLVFNCNDFACPSGTRLFDEGSEAPYNFTGVSASTVNDLCVTCNQYANDFCPASIKSTICEAIPQSRLESDPSIRCDDITPFLWPAAFIVMAFFMLGVPYLFFKLIASSSTKLEQEFPESIDESGNWIIATWDQAMLLSNNVARFLYQPFEQNMRYTRLYFLFQKLLIVFTSVFVIRIPGLNPTGIVVYCALVIHFVVFVALAYYRPFIRNFEDWLAVIMQVALVIASVLSILIFYRIDMPNALYITIVVLNFALPLLALITGILLEWTGQQAKEEEEQMKQQAEVDKELQAEQTEEERKEREQQQKIEAMKAAQEAAEAREQYERDLAEQIAEIASAIEASEQQQQLNQGYSVMNDTMTQDPESNQIVLGSAVTIVSEDNNNNHNTFSPNHQNSHREEQGHMNESTTSPKMTPNMLGEEDNQNNNNNDYYAGSSSPSVPPSNINPLSAPAMMTSSYNASPRTQQQQQQQQYGDEEYDPRFMEQDDFNKTNASGTMTTRKSGNNNNNSSRRQQEGYYDDDGNFVEAEESMDQKKRRRQAKMRRRREEVERKLKLKLESQKRLVENKRNTVDMDVDTEVKGHLNQTIMIGGIAYVVALCFCIVGLLSPEASKLTAFSDTAKKGDMNYELVGYEGWQNFTRDCCCVSMTSRDGSTEVEKWVCENSRIKERLRKTRLNLPATVGNVSSVSDDGYGIRGLCSPIFKSGCSPIVSSDKTTIGVRCSTSVSDVSGYAQEFLW